MNRLAGKVRKPTTYVLPIRKHQVYFCFIASQCAQLEES